MPGGNQIAGASRTFVVCDGERVIAYYALASSAVSVERATGRLRRNMPDPMTLMISINDLRTSLS